jgi:hypothetical protein
MVARQPILEAIMAEEIKWAVISGDSDILEYTVADSPSKSIERLERQMGDERSLKSLFVNSGFSIAIVSTVTTSTIIRSGDQRGD